MLSANVNMGWRRSPGRVLMWLPGPEFSYGSAGVPWCSVGRVSKHSVQQLIFS